MSRIYPTCGTLIPRWIANETPRRSSLLNVEVPGTQGGGVIADDDEKSQLAYCRFYAYLCKHVDHQIMEVITALNTRSSSTTPSSSA
jgi:hypothetical protein